MFERKEIAAPFEGFVEELDYDSVSDETVRLSVPTVPDVPDDDASRRFVLYLGLFDVLAEIWQLDGRADPAGFAADLWWLLGRLQAIEGPLRFALYERSDQAVRENLMSRMRGREVAVTEEWMIPKLNDEIARYSARIEALQRAIDLAEREARS